MAKRWPSEPKVCKVCGREFIPQRLGRPARPGTVRWLESKICSDPACKSETSREALRRRAARPCCGPTYKACVICGKRFAPSKFRNGRKYWVGAESQKWRDTVACGRKCGAVVAGKSKIETAKLRKVTVVTRPPAWLPTPTEIEAARREIDRANGYAERPNREEAA